MAPKYIVNASDYDQSFIISGQTITLKTRKTNPITGMVEATGVTPVEESVVDELKKAKLFNRLVEGTQLVIYDEAPREALLDSQLIDLAEAKVRELEEENDRLKEALSKGASNALKEENAALKAKIEELTKELEEAKEPSL